MHAREEIVLSQAFAQRVLRRDAGDQRCLGRGQQVERGLAEQRDRLADRVQLEVGADRGELGDAGAARVAAEGFQVVPQKASRQSTSSGQPSQSKF